MCGVMCECVCVVLYVCVECARRVYKGKESTIMGELCHFKCRFCSFPYLLARALGSRAVSSAGVPSISLYRHASVHSHRQLILHFNQISDSAPDPTDGDSLTILGDRSGNGRKAKHIL